MQVSFYSVLMAVLWSSLFSIILCLLRKFKEGYLYYNIAPLSILLFGCVFRCVLPLDFPGFTQNISSASIYASINTALYTPVIAVNENGQGITPLMIFFIVWAAGTVILSACFLWNHFRGVYFLKIYEEVESGPMYEIAMSICKKQRIKKLELYKDVSIQVPHVRGLLYPRVMLPDQEYSEAELRYILSHELAHWKNGDMWVRLITILICYLFWWNPIIYLLLYRMDETLEFRCDATVVAANCISDDERENYINTIRRAIRDKKAARQKNRLFENQLFSIRSELVKREMSKEDFIKRMDIIGDYKRDPKKERRITLFTAVFMAVVLVFSYRFILQPYYYVEKEDIQADHGTFQMSPENTYLVEEADGTYSVYVNDIFYKKVTADSAEVLISTGLQIKNSNELEK